ncbi:uncharacterized protein LOC114948387 [Acropora millepora]|uniref:uncharacterized protein LOC114948387 n=1 Tax=Acropora millepora TaxID=45264 RepID=UPI001CF538C4|nr:uncharacterized protein LOC114948387 [Acropora millepora]
MSCKICLFLIAMIMFLCQVKTKPCRVGLMMCNRNKNGRRFLPRKPQDHANVLERSSRISFSSEKYNSQDRIFQHSSDLYDNMKKRSRSNYVKCT